MSAAPTPVLYTYSFAYNPFKAALILAEKGVRYKSECIDLFSGQSLSPEYLTINPNGTVPVLVYGEKTICDSREIVEFVNSELEGAPLGGEGADQQLAASWVERVQRWDGNLFLAANSSPGAVHILKKLQAYKLKYAEARAKDTPSLKDVYMLKIKSMMETDTQSNDETAVSTNEKVLINLLDTAEQQLGITSHLAGNVYSVADAVFTPVLFRLGMADPIGQYLNPRPNIRDYYDRMKARPSFQTVFGAANNKLALAKSILPAYLKAQVAAFTGWY